MRSRRAFTLIELLIVVAVVAVLLGLVLSAVRKAREAALRAEDTNNLREVGQAFHNYAKANKGKLPVARGSSPFYQILPWLDGPYYEDVEAGRRPDNGDHELRVYISAADPTMTDPNLRRGQASFAYNARVCVGQEFRMGDRIVTVFAKPTLDEEFFADGLSNTILVTGHYAFGCDGAQFSWHWSGPALTGIVGANRKVTGRRSSFADAADIIPDPTRTPTFTFQVQPKLADCDPRVPQTPYSAGLLVGLADASVRTLSPTISPGTFWGAVTPAGGEPPAADW